MSDKSKKEASAAAGYDPAALLALYSAYGMGAAQGPTASASNSQSAAYAASNQLGLNQWYNMAQQLAAQEYLTRIQAAARDPQAYAALAAQGVLPNYEMLTGGSKARLKLPNDTEIIKYTSSATGSKEPGSSSRGRKKTISLDPNLSNADYASLAANISGSSNDSSPPSIPAGLTIERKRPGSAASKLSAEEAAHRAASPSIDRVEITKIPASANGASPLASSFMPKSSTPKASSNIEAAVSSGNSGGLNLAALANAAASASAASGGGGETPLNLSTKSSGSVSSSPFMSPIASSLAAAMAAADNTSPMASLYNSKSIAGASSAGSAASTSNAAAAAAAAASLGGGSKIPQEYYACKWPFVISFGSFCRHQPSMMQQRTCILTAFIFDTFWDPNQAFISQFVYA